MVEEKRDGGGVEKKEGGEDTACRISRKEEKWRGEEDGHGEVKE